MTTKKVAIATSVVVPNGTKDTLPLITLLKERKALVDVVMWNDKRVEWEQYDIIFLQATWDYTLHIAEFLKWIKMFPTDVSFVNSRNLIYWNTDKRYLLELEKKGVAIPNTIAFHTGKEAIVSDLSWLFRNNQPVVLKAAVSAGGRGTWLCYHPEEVANIIHQGLLHSPLLIQTYEPSVQQNGEYSAVCFDHVISHVVQKIPKEGEFRVQSQYGGSEQLVSVQHWIKDFTQQVLQALPEPARYARVDFILDANQKPKLIELELIEPDLFLRYIPKSFQQLTDIIVSL